MRFLLNTLLFVALGVSCFGQEMEINPTEPNCNTLELEEQLAKIFELNGEPVTWQAVTNKHSFQMNRAFKIIVTSTGSLETSDISINGTSYGLNQISVCPYPKNNLLITHPDYDRELKIARGKGKALRDSLIKLKVLNSHLSSFYLRPQEAVSGR